MYMPIAADKHSQKENLPNNNLFFKHGFEF